MEGLDDQELATVVYTADPFGESERINRWRGNQPL